MTSAGEKALRALERLQEITAEPPGSDADPQEVLVRADAVLGERDEVLRELGALLEEHPDALAGGAEVDALRASIHERTAAWYAALVRARHLVGERAAAVSRLRRLTRP